MPLFLFFALTAVARTSSIKRGENSHILCFFPDVGDLCLLFLFFSVFQRLITFTDFFSPENQLFMSLIFLLFSVSFISAFYYFFLALILFCSFFFKFLEVETYIIYLRPLLFSNVNILSAINIPLSTALAVVTYFDMWHFNFYSVLYVFFFLLRQLLWPIDCLEVCYSFQELRDFPVIFLFLISLTPLWSENILCMTSVLLNFLRFVL